MNSFSEKRPQRRAAAVILLALVPVAGLAQQVPPPPPEALEGGIVPADPHAILDQLSGGPAGSPTALRLNPVPGTSTSIPTTNPAAVPPIAERQGQTVVREDTGIEGQCDPVVGFGDCPDPDVPPVGGTTDGAAAGAGDATN